MESSANETFVGTFISNINKVMQKKNYFYKSWSKEFKDYQLLSLSEICGS